MKVLFAVSTENIVDSIIKEYQKEYKEIISSKNVYYFNAIIKELQRNQTYDRIVISEDLEPFTNNNYDAIDKFIIEKLDSISDEAINADGRDIPIIVICSERREKSDDLLVKLFSMAVYDALVGQDRKIEDVCKLLNKPRTKKEAKAYYRIEQGEYEYENENNVSEVEIQNILSHYRKIAKNEEKYVESFDSIAEQYNDEQLKIIIKFLPLEVKAVLEAKSEKYQSIMTFKVGDQIKKEKKDVKTADVKVEKLIDKHSKKINGPIIIPSAIKTTNVEKIAIDNNGEEKNISMPKPKKQQERTAVKTEKIVEPEIEKIEEEIEPKEQKNMADIEEKTEEIPVKRKRGRPRKVVVEEENPPKKKRGRGRPRKNPLPEEVQEEKDEIEDENKNNILAEDNIDGFEDENNNELPGFENEIEDNEELPGFNEEDEEEDNDELPGFDDEDEEEDNDELPGFDEEDEEEDNDELPGFDDEDEEEEEDNDELPGFDDEDEEEDNDELPGFDEEDEEEDNDELPGFDDEDEEEDNDELSGFDDEEEDEDNDELTDFDDEDEEYNDDELPGFDNEEEDEDNSEEDLSEFEEENNDEDNEEELAEPLRNANRLRENSERLKMYNSNEIYPNSNSGKSLQLQEEDKIQVDISHLLTQDKKVVSFVGTSKNGVSFLVNNIAYILSEKGIKTAIVDLTNNKNSYYIYTENKEELREIAYNSMEGLKNGEASGIEVSKNLTVYTSSPNIRNTHYSIEKMLTTLLKNYSLVLLDCDYTTHKEYFRASSETYLVQSMDVLTIQPLTEFLRKLKLNNILEESKLRVIINKAHKVKGLNEHMVIGGMSTYNDPEMSIQDRLFDMKKIDSTIIPFDLDAYSCYLAGIANCEMSTRGFSKNFMNYLNTLAEKVYPQIYGKGHNKKEKSYNNYEKSTTKFSNNINDTLNQMKKQYK